MREITKMKTIVNKIINAIKRIEMDDDESPYMEQVHKYAKMLVEETK